ncbi:MAG: sigma-70 family RNA polymerase sigma factor, partial [Planctomycetia bacterium]|nr:sigma-70 family RNA polymerase sigma factor [Planctomycetia bacterium]
MSVAAVRRVVSRLEPTDPPPDAELVRAISLAGANREEAFAAILHRYGPMVLGVCRRVLADAHAAEDAFQAVFLVLARKSNTICPPGAVGGWLYGVAVRTARKAKTAAARRRRREMSAMALANSRTANPDREVGGDLAQAELRAVIDTELAALPEMHRAAVVLCDLHGKTRGEAALELNRPEGTVAAWLARGRKTLAARLARRGVALPTAGLVAVATPSVVSAELASATTSSFLGRVVSPTVHALAETVMRSFSTSLMKLAAVAVTIGGVFAAITVAMAGHNKPVANPNTETPTVPTAAPIPPDVPKPDPTLFADHKGYVHSVSYSPDGKKFLSVGNGTAIVWDTQTRKKLFTVEAEFARFSEDGKAFFYLTQDEFHIADVTTGKSRQKFARGMPKTIIGGRWATISGDGSARVEFDGVAHHITNFPVKGATPSLADQKEVLTFSTLVPNYGCGGAFAPGGMTRFAGIHRATPDFKQTACLSVWELPEGKRVGTIFRDFNHPVQSFAWSPDGKEIAVGFGDGVRIFDAKTLKELRVLDKPGKWGDPLPHTTALEWSADGKALAAAVTEEVRIHKELDDGRVLAKVTAIKVAVRLLDTTTGKELRRIEGFPDNLPVISLAF